LLAGIYGLLDAANRSYRDTRALVERQQTARQVLNYLLFRLREIDGSGLVKDPRYCQDCHTPEIDDDQNKDDPRIPCPQDVRIPRRSLYIENLTTLPVENLAGVDSVYQGLSGYNSITFWADLLPITGLNDEFTDSPSNAAADTTYSANRNRVYDLTDDKDGDNDYDPGEDAEILYYDLNDNGNYDYYAEKWTFSLRKHETDNSFELIESLSFEHTTEEGGFMNLTSKNTSTYEPYTAPIAYGLTGLGIQVIPRVPPSNYPTPTSTQLMDTGCGAGRGSPNIDTCHGSKVGDVGNPAWLNIYENETAFSYARFVETHSWWNIKAISLEVATTEPQGRKFMKMKQVLIPRNLEVNQEYYKP
jgi:hypothetical protein